MKKLWDKAELIAINYLKRSWYNLIETNFKFKKFGEIDLICNLKDLTIFLEVKYRSNESYWTWEESISKQKKYKLLKSIEYYCLINKINFEKIRFDIISIKRNTNSYKLIHYKNESLN